MNNKKSCRAKVKCEGVISHFVDHLRKEAAKNQGQLTLAQIDAATQSYLSDDTLHAFFESCLTDINALQQEEHRQDIIGRLLVERFAKLLSPENNPEPGSKQFSRWIIPVFLSLVKMMVGENVYERYNQRAKQRLIALKDKLDKPTVWKEFFSTERAKLITDDILVDMAMVFDPFVQRRDWFINVINTKLKEHTLTEQDHPSRGHWLFLNRHFYALIAALYKRVRIKLTDKEQQQFLADRYGTKVSQLVSLFKEINQGKKDYLAQKESRN